MEGKDMRMPRSSQATQSGVHKSKREKLSQTRGKEGNLHM